eukprot:TRINITY_DN7189_c0_g1_i1.p1 TRINITY_DN7189_c0_g1~~TRINITY_DN7189_c0_g1_i1.p1  ORF type:complete len:587 (+),score=237.92 TRINITY_DN7189_c0_g1_i1:1121-2881(+)
MFRGVTRRLLCLQGKPVFNVVDGHKVQVVPNRLSIAVENCEVRGIGEEALPFWRLETQGLESGEEVVMIKGRDIMRPRDQTMLLGLFESIHEMVKEGAVLDEGAEVPLETGRQTRKREPLQDMSPEGFDHLHSDEILPEAPESEISLWLTFYAHPDLVATRFLLLVPPHLRALTTTFRTPLRLTNLMFKHNSWNYLPPAAYRETPVPSQASIDSSVLSTQSALAVPGMSITMSRGCCTILIPDNGNSRKILGTIEPGAEEVLLVASRHEQGIDGFCCWDPDKELDSLVISTRGDAQNWNDTATGATDAKIGGTFVKLTADPSAEQRTVEDGFVIPVDKTAILQLATMEDVETPNLCIRWVKGVVVSTPALDEEGAEEEHSDVPMDDWLGYIKNAVGRKESEKQREASVKVMEDERRKNLSRVAPEMVHFKTEVRPVVTEAKEEVKEKVEVEEAKVEVKDVEEQPAEERTTVEPRMVKADFGEFADDAKAQDEEWEKYVIRIATVLSAVFSHCGRRKRPTRGKDEPGSVLVEIIPKDDGTSELKASVQADVCSMELIPNGVDILNERLKKHCGKAPHPLTLSVWFSL